MKAVHELKKILDKELEAIVAKGSITPTDLENSKHIVEIFAMVKALDSDDQMYDEGHSGHYKYQYRYPDQRYVDWGYGRSYMSPEEDYGRSYGRHGMGYSGHEPMEYIIMELKRLHAKTSDDHGREVIENCIEELER